MGKIIYEFRILGKYPSLNEYIEKCRKFPKAGNNMKQKYQKMIVYDILEQSDRLRLNQPIWIDYTFYEANKRRDKDNVAGFFHKVFQDALVTAKVIPNDNWLYVEGFSDHFRIDSKNPRIEVKIEEVET